VHLASEYIKNKSFPDKAIDLMDEAASKVSIENVDGKTQEEWPKVGVAEVQSVMEEWQENKEV
jgi:ATP-dependent Clp protease ATP-binding subunit ClpC